MRKIFVLVLIVSMVILTSCFNNTPEPLDDINKTETTAKSNTLVENIKPPEPVGDESYMLSDILMLKITKNYLSTSSYEFSEGEEIPFDEIFEYYSFDGCFSFDERTLSATAVQYYDEETRMFSVPHEIADDFLEKRFNTRPDPQSVECYNEETGCYVFARHLGTYNFDARIASKAELRKNVYEFSVELTYSLDPAEKPALVCSFIVELNETGYTYLACEINELNDASA